MDSESRNNPINTEDSLEEVQPSEVVEVAEVVETARYAEPIDGTSGGQEVEPASSHQLPSQFQNVAAKGGAIGALALGCLAVFGAFITQWSLFNAVVGLVLGLWGLSSNMPRIAILGIVLCGIGFLLCVTVPSMF